MFKFLESVCHCCSPAYQRTSREGKEGELNFISTLLKSELELRYCFSSWSGIEYMLEMIHEVFWV
jgi:hypothetical protein